jgi:hypothetical protein
MWISNSRRVAPTLPPRSLLSPQSFNLSPPLLLQRTHIPLRQPLRAGAEDAAHDLAAARLG